MAPLSQSTGYLLWRQGQKVRWLSKTIPAAEPRPESGGLPPSAELVGQHLALNRYTGPARLALFHARAGVSEHGGTAIADAHLLLGILKAAPELGPLMRPTVNIQRLSECLVGAVAAPTLLPTSVDVPFDPAVKAALLEAPRVADRFGQFDMTPAHLFLAVLEQPPSAAAECLRSAGIDLATTTEAVAAFARGGP